MKSISEYIDDLQSKWGEEPYIYTKECGNFTAKTYTKTVSDVKNLAKAMFKELGENYGCMIYAENSYEWLIIDLAAMGYGGVSIPADKEWTLHDLENAMNFIRTDAFFYSKSRSEVAEKLAQKFTKTKFYCIEESFAQLISVGESLPNDALVPRIDMNFNVKIIFTSGTTAIPKAIPLSQANMFNNWNTLFERTPMINVDKSCVFLPLNHVYSGVANFLYSIISGMKLYISSDITEHVRDIVTVRPSVVCTVPLLLKRMYQNMTPELLSVLREIKYLYCGGSFTEPEIKRWFRENGVNLLEAYGTTETSSVIALDKPGESCIESNGTIFENLDVKIIEPDAEGYGEVIVRGGSRTCGYLNYPHNELYFDAEGYFHTGDLGKIDNERRLFLRGRKKRMLETSDGKNVYADEIEELLISSPIINKARVYLEDYKIAALVYSTSDRSVVEAAVAEINEKLPKFKKIKQLHINDDKLGSRIK